MPAIAGNADVQVRADMRALQDRFQAFCHSWKSGQVHRTAASSASGQSVKVHQWPEMLPTLREGWANNSKCRASVHSHFTSGNWRRTWREPTSRLNVL